MSGSRVILSQARKTSFFLCAAGCSGLSGDKRGGQTWGTLGGEQSLDEKLLFVKEELMISFLSSGDEGSSR